MNKAYNYQKENGFFSIPTEENYHMNLDALKAFMPEKYRLLEELHEVNNHQKNLAVLVIHLVKL